MTRIHRKYIGEIDKFMNAKCHYVYVSKLI